MPTAKKRGSKRGSPGVRKKTVRPRAALTKRELERQRDYPVNPLPAQHQRSPGRESKVYPRPQYDAPLYRAAGKLEGKIALVTGGDSGIGRAAALLFAREGANVALVYLPPAERRCAPRAAACAQTTKDLRTGPKER